MSSNDQSGYTASDVITYFGVPLAVLGVLPILYNTVATLAALSKIKRMLRHGRLTALTRSDVVNRVIEVELPRYAVTPWDRFSQRSEYWQLSRRPSSIPGGSWTTFNWKTNAIGIKTQRVEYADQLRQPQVEVSFDELVAYLLDLGAVPDAHGWRLLRSTGLWTPMGCTLMRSPDDRHYALTIAPLDDSDGHLSLKVNWSPEWTTRNFDSLPPYWVRLPPPPRIAPKQEEKAEPGGAVSSSSSTRSREDLISVVGEGGEKTCLDDSKDGAKKDQTKESASSTPKKQAEKDLEFPITSQISVDGLITALTQEDGLATPSLPHYHHNNNHHENNTMRTLPIEHLRIHHLGSSATPPSGVWFASAATAYGTSSSQTILWNYRVPDAILAFARRDTVPCGVLVLLGAVDESATPQWGSSSAATDRHAREEASDLFFRRSADQRLALQAEARMSPPQREAAARERTRREAQLSMQDMRDRSRLEAQRREARVADALQSPRWDNAKVAAAMLRWLVANEVVLVTTSAISSSSSFSSSTPEDKENNNNNNNLNQDQDEEESIREAVSQILRRAILDPAFASALARILNLWKTWADNGGMRRSDLDELWLPASNATIFAQATLLVALIKSGTTRGRNNDAAVGDNTLAVDLQECLRMWRVVRLG